MLKQSDISVFIMAALDLHLTDARKVLDEKNPALRQLYIKTECRGNKYIVTRHEGVDMLVPSVAVLIFSPLFKYPCVNLPKATTMRVVSKKIKKYLTKSELADVRFVLDFMEYQERCIDVHNKKLVPIIVDYMKMVQEGSEVEGDKRYITSASPFNSVSTVFSNNIGNKILASRVPKLEKMEKKILKIEAKILKELNLVSILGVIPDQ